MNEILVAFGWRDVVDIAIVAAVVYRVLLVFRGTRAVQMLVGLGLLIGATIVAHRFELHTLQWLFDNLWAFWVIALVVLFQPELRRALTRMGQGRVLRSLARASRHERVRVVEEVATAAETLAGRGTGALIILERATGLRQYAEIGVPLDALVSADLLVSLFQLSSPLHDGAVLIQGSRIVAAGCFLPLSRNLQLGRALGTRHRAALGIAEETDGVAVVVSEETARISIAVDGQIEPTDGEALRGRLDRLLGGAGPAERPALLRGVRRLLPRADDNV